MRVCLCVIPCPRHMLSHFAPSLMKLRRQNAHGEGMNPIENQDHTIKVKVTTVKVTICPTSEEILRFVVLFFFL